MVGPVQICLPGELLSRAQPAAESGPCRSEPRNSCDPEGEKQGPKSPEEKGRLAEGLALGGITGGGASPLLLPFRLCGHITGLSPNPAMSCWVESSLGLEQNLQGQVGWGDRKSVV